MNNLMKNKKGVMGIVIFFLVMFTILIIGFIGAMVITVIDFGSETITPVMTDLGVVGTSNVSEASEITFGTVNTLVNSLPWLLTFSYVAMLIFSVIFVVSYRMNPNPAYIGIYFLFCVLLIFGAIFMSNMYQDLLSSDDAVIGDGLRSQTSMSYLMIHSPLILSVLVFIVGIYIFVGKDRQSSGGFDV